MTLGNIILDLVLLLMLVIGLVSGWRRGLLAFVLKGGAGILSAILSVSFYRPVGELLKGKYFLAPIRSSIDGAVLDLVGPTPTPEELTSSVPENLKNVAGLLGVDLNEMAGSAIAEGGNVVEKFSAGAADMIAGFLGLAVAFLLLFIGSYIVLRIFSKPLSKVIMKIPLLGGVNRLFGLIVGGLLSFLLVWVLVFAVALVDQAAGLAFLEVDETVLGGFFHRTLSLSSLIGGN